MSARPCPVCRRAPAAAAYAPFCSRRCADVDLQRWFSGAYAVAGGEDDDAAPAAARDHGSEDEPGAPGHDRGPRL